MKLRRLGERPFSRGNPAPAGESSSEAATEPSVKMSVSGGGQRLNGPPIKGGLSGSCRETEAYYEER